jgi:uncharacterized protein (DUF433 family)/DNA-binding transcriptional regulator YdaS (Cro superfamily)
MTRLKTRESRFTVPLYTVPEAARFLGVPTTTFANWARGYRVQPAGRKPVIGRPIVTAVDGKGLHPSIPFVGLAEGLVVAAFRRSGVSLQHIRRAVEVLEREIGIEHALASRKLFSDGAGVLYDYAEYEGADELLTHVVTQQRVFADVVKEYLELITHDPAGWAARLISPITYRPVIVADPERAFGQPIFIRGGIRVEDVLDRIRADEPPAEVAEDFGVPLEDIEAVVSAELRRAA